MHTSYLKLLSKLFSEHFFFVALTKKSAEDLKLESKRVGENSQIVRIKNIETTAHNSQLLLLRSLHEY